MGAPGIGKDDAVATPEKLEACDGVLFGVPTRFGMAAAQVKAFMDKRAWNIDNICKVCFGVTYDILSNEWKAVYIEHTMYR